MNLPRVFCVFALWVVGPLAGMAAAASSERIEASFLLAWGRPAQAVEQAAWQERTTQPLSELLEAQRARLRGDAVARRAVFARAWRDAFGQAPNAPEAAAPGGGIIYAEQLEELVGRLASRPEEYRDTIGRAYQVVIGRAPYPDEIEYWRAYPALPYIGLVGCLENWARRNAPGLMVTSGVAAISVTSDLLVTLRLSPALAAEVRGVIGRPAEALATARGCNVLMPGADGTVSVGGVSFLAVGSDTGRRE